MNTWATSEYRDSKNIPCQGSSEGYDSVSKYPHFALNGSDERKQKNYFCIYSLKKWQILASQLVLRLNFRILKILNHKFDLK